MVKEKKTIRKRTLLGVGCFHFGVSANEYPLKIETCEYRTKLISALESINNITNISVIIPETEIPESIIAVNEETDIEKYVYPSFGAGKIEFEIYIPTRIQQKITDLGNIKIYKHDCGTEQFKVTILYRPGPPVTYIELLNSEKAINPSTSIQIVREYLRSEFKDKRFAPIKFESLGPSPFHADFYLEPGEIEQEEPLLSKIKSPRGYSEITILYNPAYFNNVDKAKQHFMYQALVEFSSFYKLEQYRAQKIIQWSKIQDKIQELTTKINHNYIMQIWTNLVAEPILARSIFLDLSQFVSETMFKSSSAKILLKNIYTRDSIGFIKEQMTEVIDDVEEDYPTEIVERVVDYYINRSISRSQNFATIVNAVIAGLLTVLLTILTNSNFLNK